MEESFQINGCAAENMLSVMKLKLLKGKIQTIQWEDKYMHDMYLIILVFSLHHCMCILTTNIENIQ